MNARLMLQRLALLGLFSTLLLGGCSDRDIDLYHGYIEGDYLQIACPLSGILTNLGVTKGAVVTVGSPLFVLEQAAECASLTEAEARLKQAEARLDDLTKGARVTELTTLSARVEQARAAATLSSTNYSRAQLLLTGGSLSQSELDQARKQSEADAAQLQALTAELETAALGGRDDLIRAATAEREAVTAAMTRAQWAVNQKTQHAPVSGLVEDTMYRVGEFVPAGRPIVRILPPENVNVRFFVPQGLLAGIQSGKKVQVLVDGQASELTATVSAISTQVEFTPPVIYSRENRDKLVVMIEASFSPDVAKSLHPGQPVDVRLTHP